MRDTRAITGICLIVATIILSTIFLSGVLVSPSGRPQANPRQDINAATSPTLPTTLDQQLSSVTVGTPGEHKALGITKDKNNGNGHAYGIVKQSAKASRTMIQDTVTVSAIHGTIPGQTDLIDFQAYYNGTPYCAKSATFNPTGLTSYTTTFTCEYMGAGTYNFKVAVYNNGTLIGDPTASMTI